MENILKLRDRIYNVENAYIELTHRNDSTFLQIVVIAKVADLWDEIDSITFSLGEGGKQMEQSFSIDDLTHFEINPTDEDFANTYTVEADEMGDNIITIDKLSDDNYYIKWSGLCNPRITKGFTTDVPFEIECSAQFVDARKLM